MQKKNSQAQNQDEEVKQEIKGEELLLDFNKPDFTFIPSARHRWKQQGPYLVCTSCELQHAVYIGMDKIMVGEDEDGKPILKNRSKLTQG